MGIYNSIVLHDSVIHTSMANLSELPDQIDISDAIWQTKDLNPSMDMYAMLPYSFVENDSEQSTQNETESIYLYRRHPPITRWSNINEGLVPQSYPEEIISSADHWRQVRYSGFITMTYLTVNEVQYTVRATVSHGKVITIDVQSVEEIDSLQGPP